MSDTTGTTTSTDSTDANQDAQDQSTEDSTQDSQDSTETEEDAEEGDENKTYDQKYVTGLRQESAKYRTKAKDAEARATSLQGQLDAINKIFNPDAKKGEAPDPDALNKANVELRRENALLRLAPKEGGDYDLLVDSRSFMQSIADIDPDDSKALSGKIKEAVQNNPSLGNKPQGGSRKSGGDLGGGSDEKKLTLEQFKALSYEAKADLFRNDKPTYDKFAAQL